MSLRGLAALILALAAAVALIHYWKPKPPPAEPGASAPLVTPFSEAGVQRVEIACSDTTATLERTGPASWRLVAPQTADADPRAVHTLLVAVQDARVHKRIAEAASDPAAFGLKPPACQLTLALDGVASPRVLTVGRASPVGADRYAKDADGRVVLTDGALYTGIARTPEALREKRLVPVDPDAVTRIEVSGPGGDVAVVRDGKAWRLTAPLEDAADGEACAKWARAITTPELTDTGTTRVPAMSRADRRIRIAISAGAGTPPLEAFLAAAGIGGRRLAWRGAGSLAGLLTEGEAGAIERTPEALRDPSIASYAPADAVLVAITRGASVLRLVGAAGGATWTASESGGTEVTADASKVQSLLDRFRDVRAAGFLEAPPAGAPTGTISIRGGAQELARFTWGPLSPEKGQPESVWVTTPSRAGTVFRVQAALFGPLPRSASELAKPGVSPSPSP